MKIGAQDRRSSAISTSNAETILVRGRDLCAELIGKISFTDHVWLLVTGDLPSPSQRRVLDATLVAIAEHGLVPSVQASRLTLAAAPEALQGAVAAGILGCGSVILGSTEAAGRLFDDVLTRSPGDLESGARAVLGELVAARRAIPGYGHPLHKGYDPRSRRLLEIATEAGLAGRHIEVSGVIERLRLPEAERWPHGIQLHWKIDRALHGPARFIANKTTLRSDRAFAPYHEHAFGSFEFGFDRLPPRCAAADSRVPPDSEAFRLERCYQGLHALPVFSLVGYKDVAHPPAPITMSGKLLTTVPSGNLRRLASSRRR